jgi:type III secretory pathway component EscR
MKALLKISRILSIAIALLVSSWVGYRYFERHQSINGVDSFVEKYVQSLVNGTNYYKEHTEKNQIAFADEIRKRFASPYTVTDKAISDGLYFFLYSTGFQFILKFQNGKYLYLHLLGRGPEFIVLGVIDWTDQMESKKNDR